MEVILREEIGKLGRRGDVVKVAAGYARSLDEKPVVLAVWDGQPGDGPGGTADAVQLWREEGYEPEIIDTRTL